MDGIPTVKIIHNRRRNVKFSITGEGNHSVTWGKPVNLSGILPELYQVRVHVMDNICWCLIQPFKDYLVSVDTKERWHYKVLPLSLPDLQNPVRLNGYLGKHLFITIATTILTLSSFCGNGKIQMER